MDFPVKSSANPNIQYELLTLEDVNDVTLFCMEHFYPREPFGMFNRIETKSETMESFTQTARFLIKKGTSYKAVDVSQKHRQLVGVKLAQIIRKNEKSDDLEDSGQYDVAHDAAVTKFLAALKEDFDYFSIFHVDSYFMHEITGVREDYGGRGICSELLRLAEHHARVTDNIQVFVATTTNVRTQKAYSKAGYEILRQLEFATFLDVPVREVRNDTGCLQVKYIPDRSLVST